MSIDTFTSELLKSVEDKSVEEERNKEIIRDTKILQRSEIPENIWNDIFLDKSLNLKINGTFSYNPSHLIEIENKEEFDFLYTTNKLQ